MLHSLSTRARFFIAAMIVGLSSTLFTIFVPILYSQTVYFDTEVLVWFIPTKNFVLLGLAFVIVCTALVLLGWKRNPVTYVLTVILFASSFFVGYLSFLSVTILDEETLYIKDVFHEQTYRWTDLEEVVLTYDEENYEEYVFTYQDGTTLRMWKNPHLKEKESALYHIFRKLDIPYTVRAK